MFHSFDYDSEGTLINAASPGRCWRALLLILNIKIIDLRLLLHHLGPGASTGCPEMTGKEIQFQIKGREGENSPFMP